MSVAIAAMTVLSAAGKLDGSTVGVIIAGGVFGTLGHVAGASKP